MKDKFRRPLVARLLALVGAAVALHTLLKFLPNPTSITIENEDLKFVSGQLINFDMRGTTLVALALMMAVLIIALKRRDQIISLQKQILISQQNRISSIDEIVDSHAIVCETNKDGEIEKINDKFSEILEYHDEEIVGQSETVLFENGELEESLKKMKEQTKNKNIWFGEERIVSKSGRILRVQSTAIPSYDATGQLKGNLILRTDQTEKRKNEAAKYLSALLQNLQEEVYIYDVEDLSISYMNELALKRAKWTTKDVMSKKIYDISAEFDLEVFRAHVKPIIDGEQKSASIEIKLHEQYFEISTRLFVGPDEIPVFVSISRNITQRKTSEKQRLASVSTVSHELRAPLTSIQGSLKLIKSGAVGELSPKLESMIDIASRNSNRMLLVVNDILDLEKIKSGRMEFNFQSVDLEDIVDEAVNANRTYCEMHDVAIIVNSKEGSYPIVGDEMRLVQVMTNLITNAAKYSRPGSCIDVTICSEGDCYKISVSDSGPGIAEEDLPRIFESFCQLEAVDGKKREGTGLGLSISKEIIRAHDGQIFCKSEVGIGSTFYFEVPMDKDRTTSKKLISGSSIQTHSAH